MHLGDLRMKKVVIAFVCGAVALSLSVNSAYAVKPFLDEFMKKYPEVKGAAEKKCGVCHEGADKKVRNDYGKALNAHIKKTDAKDVEKIGKAFDAVAKENAKFGDNLKAGKLPTE
jgi:hypothetical protein